MTSARKDSSLAPSAACIFGSRPARKVGTLSAVLLGASMVGCQRARGLGFSVVVLYPGCMLESLMEIGGRWGEFWGAF